MRRYPHHFIRPTGLCFDDTRARLSDLRVSTPDVSKLAIIIQQGKVLDFIDGKPQRNETPEEYVRQEIAKSLVREYRYEKACVEVEFTIRVGSRKPRADLVIFPREGSTSRRMFSSSWSASPPR
jgi:hypothetical protein